MSVSEEEEKILKGMGIRIGRRREALNKTQEEIASSLKIDRGNYTKMENGNRERRFNYSQLVSLVETLDTSFDYIFGKTNEATSNIDIKNFCNEYGLTEETLKKIKTLNENSLISFNDFINGTHITPYLFEEMYCCSVNKNISKNLILFFNVFNYAELFNKYYKEKNIKELQTIFDYFDKFLIDANKKFSYYRVRYLQELFEVFKIYLTTEDFKTIYYQKKKEKMVKLIETRNTDVNIDINGINIDTIDYSLLAFQNSNYGNKRNGGEVTDINISNYLFYMKSIATEILQELHKEVSYNEYTISRVFEEYLNRIEGFQYAEDIEKFSLEDTFIKALNKEQNKIRKEGENNECKRNRKK